MEDVLAIYSRPYNADIPVVCMDEKPVQFFASARRSIHSQNGRIEYEDNEYIRNGTAAIFMFTEPLAGWHYANALEHQTRTDWAKQMEWLLVEQYPHVKKVILIMDNLNTHVVASKAFSYANNTVYLLLQQWAKHRHSNKNKWWRLNKYWHEKNGKPWLFMTDESSLINLRRIAIIRHPKLRLSKNPFIDEAYFTKRRLRLQTLFAARNG